jgi:hypothetical protein
LLRDLLGDLLGLMAARPYPKAAAPRQLVALSQAVMPGLAC